MRKDLIISAILHDIGKVIYRSGRKASHSFLGYEFLREINRTISEDKTVFSDEVLNAVRYHHIKDLKEANLEKDALAYIVYEADNIASGIDRREIEGEEGSTKLFDKYTPLKSVYSLLNKNTEKKYYSGVTDRLIKDLIMPDKKADLSIGHYSGIKSRFSKNLKAIGKDIREDSFINSLLELVKSTLYYVPSSTNTQEVCDISLYLHSKLTACLASGIYDYLNINNQTDYKTVLLSNNSFRDKQAFLMASVDISGIQNFIYTITTSSAKKQLRARSLYVELIMENLIDELLVQLGYSRCNLLYSGGGHFYLLIANTEENKQKFNNIIQKQNDWFIENFGISLYVASALASCSANDLMPKTVDDSARYRDIFACLQKQLSRNKVQRYSYKQINNLNNFSNGKKHSRECSVCGMVTDTKKNYCEICASLIKNGAQFIKEDSIFAVINDKKDIKTIQDLPLKLFSYEYDSSYLLVCDRKDIAQFEGVMVRQYSKNSFDVGKNRESTIFMGDYTWNEDFEKLVEASIGIKRLGVLRADIDDLGKAFVKGFNVDDKINYSTISRTSAFSESLSMFFKYYINIILKSKTSSTYRISLNNQDNTKEERRVSIIYSGGDDLFVVGSWDAVLEFAIDFNNYMEQFTNQKLTMSAGLGIYPSKYPISAMAIQTGELEALAKGMGKNRIALFDNTQESVFGWDELENNVIKEKLYFIISHYHQSSMETSNMSQIYKLLEYIKNIDKDKNNLARLAYSLARIQETLSTENNNKEFINKLYKWSSNDQDRKELLMALTIYIYLNREDK